MTDNEMIDETGSVYDIKEVNELHDDLLKCLSYDEWSSREYGNDVVDFDDTAYGLYKLGYRKVLDGAIVLTKDNVGELLAEYKEPLCREVITIFYNDVRKETAMDYYDKMAQEIELHNFESTRDYEYMNVCNKEILKEYGVEVEE